MRKHHALFVSSAVLASAIVFAACNDDIVCAGVSTYALEVVVLDSISGQPIAQGATLVALDGVFKDSITGQVNNQALPVGRDRPGTYELRLTKAGYKPWQQTVASNASNGCSLPPRSVTARLQSQS